MSEREIPQAQPLDWSAGTWSAEPEVVSRNGDALLVTAVEGSDAWRHTAYGFVHDSAHALLAPLEQQQAMEVRFLLDYRGQYDQAGIMLRVDAEHWIKSGVEISDGLAQAGAVVTAGKSDWSLAPVPEWMGRAVTVRMSRAGDAVTIRIRVEDEPYRLLRVVPLDPEAQASAGPYCCAPSRAGLQLRFLAWRKGAADAALHEPTTSTGEP